MSEEHHDLRNRQRKGEKGADPQRILTGTVTRGGEMPEG